MGKKSKVGKSRRDKFYHLAKETGENLAWRWGQRGCSACHPNNHPLLPPRLPLPLLLQAAPAQSEIPVPAEGPGPAGPVCGPRRVASGGFQIHAGVQPDHWGGFGAHQAHSQCGDPAGGHHHRQVPPANLTLMALKLACEFLCKGGWFITKVFRSRDYQPLLWIFQQFFQKVQATKPQASRNESAEIFVVCQGYQAPDKIDSKFFDPKYAFKDVEVPTKSVSELVSRKKPKAEGYTEGDTTLYHRFTLMDFLKAPNPVDFLSKANEITLGDGELENHSSTTEELRQCCRDIRVLGRKELRALLNWRTKLRRFLAKKLKEQAKALDINLSSDEEEESREEEKKEKMEAKAAAAEEAKEQEEVELALAEMKAEELAELKRKKKKILKEQRKQRERVELKMDLPGVSIADDGDTSMFSLRSIHRTPLLDELSRGDMASADALLETSPGDDDIYVSDHDEEDDVSLASDLDPEELLEIEARQRKLEREQRGKRPKFKQKEEEEEEEGQEVENPLLVPLEEKSVLEERQTNLWFGKDAFAGIEDDADEELELGQAQMLAERQREAQREKTTKKEQKKKKKKVVQEETPAEPTPAAATAPDASEAQKEQSSDDDSSSEDERPLVPVGRKRGRVEPCGFEVVPIEKPVKRVLDAEGLALGSVIATSKKARRDLIDDSFNRYSYNEEEGELPEWFTEEERQHRRRQLPVDKQTVEAYRQRWKEINARPIKKVAEAKARKKRRMLKKLEQMKKKAEAVVSTVDISEREKVAQLRRIYKKAGLAKEKRQVTYLVAKKGVGPRVRRPPGVKGQFKVVDSRLKKDVRAQKRKEQKKKRHK
uniref:FtsJ RNA 2'-O-methyltransferase 3 n=1 Tax=Cyanoderma ruficeps TaxID=181631 RepID=A0A8C3R4M4_9PASS